MGGGRHCAAEERIFSRWIAGVGCVSVPLIFVLVLVLVHVGLVSILHRQMHSLLAIRFSPAFILPSPFHPVPRPPVSLHPSHPTSCRALPPLHPPSGLSASFLFRFLSFTVLSFSLNPPTNMQSSRPPEYRWSAPDRRCAPFQHALFRHAVLGGANAAGSGGGRTEIGGDVSCAAAVTRRRTRHISRSSPTVPVLGIHLCLEDVVHGREYWAPAQRWRRVRLLLPLLRWLNCTRVWQGPQVAVRAGATSGAPPCARARIRRRPRGVRKHCAGELRALHGGCSSGIEAKRARSPACGVERDPARGARRRLGSECAFDPARPV
ncbi:hypothetical protein DFH09DRAFT_1426834 [Mycena vulgaris]|nr:hypothetical protein DFH09DRAFT_1426834 [Mycena vulgaris]